MGLFDKLVNKAAEKIGDAVKKGTQQIVKPVVQKAEDTVSGAVQKAEDKVAEAAHKTAEKAAESLAKEREKKAAEAEAAKKAAGLSFEEAEAACAAAGAAAAEGEKPGWGEGGVDAYWDKLDNEWQADQARNDGYVWTVTVDHVATVNAMGFAKVKYDLDLSCSHVGPEMDGVYRGSLAMVYGADISGVTEMIGSLGGRTSADSLAGWFRNDKFIMKLSPYNKEKEQGFIGSLELVMNEDHDLVQRPQNAYTNAMLASMNSPAEAFEQESDPVSYWFDWDYYMTSGDIAYTYSVSGVMGIGSGKGSIDASGRHVEGSGRAVSPWGVFTDRYEKDYDAPFPYVIRVYEGGKVVFELHSPEGGPFVIRFYGHIDRIPVSQTTVVG